MKIAHVGPPLARRGGPAGYLWQLEAAVAAHAGGSRHRLTFPVRETPIAPVPLSRRARTSALIRRARRALVGPRTFYRPSDNDLRRAGGAVDALVTASLQSVCVEARPSLDAALTSDADVLFTHDTAVAERLLAHRRSHQQVWLLMHSPMPVALYLAWSWGIPEWDWTEIVRLPDVDRWTAWEFDVCSRVDRLVVPCSEAFADLVRADGRFAALTPDRVLTGAAGPSRQFPAESRGALRRRWSLPRDTPVALFLGSAQPYRSLDVLIDAVKLLPPNVRGVVAIAGPSKSRVPAHSRLRPVGAVGAVSDLLHAVDVVVNVNSFSLFDLSTIEAAEAGRPLLLHAVGGNLRFERLGAGCVMLRDLAPSTVAAGLQTFFGMSEAERRALGEASRACYDRHLTPAHLWANHVALYDRAVAEHTVARS